MTNLNILKTFANKGLSSLYAKKKKKKKKALVFPVVMYGYETWTIKKAEYKRIDAFELWCWRKLFESPLDCKEAKPVNPKGNQF